MFLQKESSNSTSLSNLVISSSFRKEGSLLSSFGVSITLTGEDFTKLSLRRNEIGLDLGPEQHKFNLTYISLNRELTADELVDREEISATGRTKISSNWFLKGTTRRDLTSDGGYINSGADDY